LLPEWTSIMASEVVRWVLRDGERQLTCVSRPLGEGSELAVVYYDGLPLRSRVCVNDADGMQWANDVRSSWMAHGWTPSK
jgi:hypothetical protein